MDVFLIFVALVTLMLMISIFGQGMEDSGCIVFFLLAIILSLGTWIYFAETAREKVLVGSSQVQEITVDNKKYKVFGVIDSEGYLTVYNVPSQWAENVPSVNLYSYKPGWSCYMYCVIDLPKMEPVYE